MSLGPLRVLPSYREKVWGSADLAPWFPAQPDVKIGEVWFTFDDNVTADGRRLRDLSPSGSFPILVKFLFTSGKLSIQVHPNDQQARAWEGSPGKTEMWHILRAEPGAQIALGPREPVTRARLREAASTGEIERLVGWIEVRPGDTFLTPPGTIHAIGGGVALCEIQQNSDVTYRLYDYGRPRELHLDKAVAVANLEPHPGPAAARDLGGGRRLLASCPYFETEAWELSAPVEYVADAERIHTLVIIEGAGKIAGQRFGAGEVWLAPPGAGPFAIEPEGPARLLRTYVP